MSVEIVVGILIGWAARKGGRAAQRVRGVSDQVMEQVARLVVAELVTDPAIQKLLSEAQETGDAAPGTRRAAATAIQQAAARDPRFAEQVRAALPAEDGPAARPGRSGGMSFDNIRVEDTGGDVTIGSNNKFTTKVRENPLVTLVAIAAVAIALWLGWKALDGSGDAGAGGPAALAGAWSASDGTGTKTFDSGGACDGFYYDDGRPLDIGGPMTCTVGTVPDAEGRYTLTVRQPPNRATYKIHFDAGDHAVVYTTSGRKLYELTRS